MRKKYADLFSVNGWKHCDVTFTHRGETIDDIPKAEITNNGDITFHCGSFEEAKWFAATICSMYDVFHSRKSQKEE